MVVGKLGARTWLRVLTFFGVSGVASAAAAGLAMRPRPVLAATPVTVLAPADPPPSGLTFLDSLFGRSGKLRARFVSHSAALPLPALQRHFGDSAAGAARLANLADSALRRAMTIIPLRPFSDKVRGRIGSYRMGYWPSERRRVRGVEYASPDGFIEVTRDNQDTFVSEHFRLRDFLTHDQPGVWPKYLVLNERLIDKLELVIDDLVNHGVSVSHLSIMSGFRSPQYNRRGVSRGGRADASRHQYGDAADVFVDNDRDGRMDDLNWDGRVDYRDARLLLEAVDRVESAYPTLVGGAGVYRGTRRHGPFAHIDARGYRARWGRS